MNNKGMTQIELILSLLISINLFVLSTQMFYNINKETIPSQTEWVKVESFVTKIEYELKYVDSIDRNVTSETLTYVFDGSRYYYYLHAPDIMLKINNGIPHRFLSNVQALSFEESGNMILVKVTNDLNEIYTARIIIRT